MINSLFRDGFNLILVFFYLLVFYRSTVRGCNKFDPDSPVALNTSVCQFV